MAGREKKPALIKKQNISTALSKDSDNQLDNAVEKTSPLKNTNNSKTDETSNKATPVKKIVRAKKAAAAVVTTPKALKTKINKIKFKAKTKTVKKIKLGKTLFKNKKVIDPKNVAIVKNGIKKRGRPKDDKKEKISAAKIKKEKVENDKNLPPLLEAMISTPEQTEKPQTPKKEPKKRTKKQIAGDSTDNTLPVDPKKIKVEPIEETGEDVVNDEANNVDTDVKPVVKKPRKRVTKTVLNPAAKARKPRSPRKPKAETAKGKRGVKKEIIIDTLSKDIDIDSDAQSVINKLDLNVDKVVKKSTIKKRRHSIEKFNSVSDGLESPFETPFTLFSTLRSGSPKIRRGGKLRQSIDKHQSPYSTRSDSPARILRNGKNRKLRKIQLLAGIETEYKRRRRLCSEVSTSTNDISKFSDDLSESDSNFSDMTNITENGIGEEGSLKDEGLTKSELLKKEILETLGSSPGPEEIQNLNIKQISTKFTAILKRSLSTETSQTDDEIKPKIEDLNSALTDTNSNDLKLKIKSDETDEEPSEEKKTDLILEIVKTEPEETNPDKITSPSYKVPEKLFILDQMKQIFNDNETENVEPIKKVKSPSKRVVKLSTSEDGTERTIETVPVAKFYGSEQESKNEEKVATTEEIVKNDETDKIIVESDKPINQNDEQVEESNENDNILEENDKIIEENNDVIEKAEETQDSPDATIEKLQDELELMVQEESVSLREEDCETIENITVEIEKGEALINENNNIDAKKIVETEIVTETLDHVEQTETEQLQESASDEKMDVDEDFQLKLPLDESEEHNEEVESEEKNPHLEILNKLRENSSLSICVKPGAEFKSKSGSESGESMSGTTMSNIVSEAIKKLDEDKSESMSVDSSEETLKEKNENCVETNSEKSLDATEINLPSMEIIETPENMAIKENILSALGLRSLKAAEEDAKERERNKAVNNNKNENVYTGTLKTVIKLNRSVDSKKKSSKDKERNPLKMTLQKSKGRSSKDIDCDNMKSDGASGKYDSDGACYKVMKETSSSSTSRHSTDTVGANRKSHYSNRSNLEGDQHSDTDYVPEGETGAKELVIPEKASSFSIHPGRLCSDTCAYCFGKFGLFDTPLHIAQMKNIERQNKILQNEFHLARDSCLCDACYRHVDRKATTGVSNKSLKRSSNSAPHVNYCQVLGCDHESTNMLRRKWLLKMKKAVLKLVNIDLENPNVHSIPVCSDHYTAVEHLMVCALCKRRLTRNHIHYLASECESLNAALQKEGIPVTLNDKPLVCKLCRYFSSLLLKPPPLDSTSNTAEFFRQYKKRLLQYYDIEVPEEEENSDQNSSREKDGSSSKEKKKTKTKSSKKLSSNSNNDSSSNQEYQNTEAVNTTDQLRVPSNNENGESQSRASTPSDTVIDYEALVPNLSLECSSDMDENNSNKQTNNEVPNNQKEIHKKLQIPETVREAVEISKIMNKVKKQDLIGKLECNPSISVRQLFQGEEELPLYAHLDFDAVKEKTPEGWEKSVCTIQYSNDTKQLWQELQKPYGNQSSFLRHLILLEKYFRNGDLTLSPSASHHAVNYSVSVQNRLRAYDNIPSGSVPMQPLTMLPFNQVKKSTSGIITTREAPQLSTVINAANLPKNTPIPISQLNLNPNLLTQLSVRQKTPSVPPGLISIQQNQKPKPQKVKIPVNKNWKPTLIPITAATTAQDRRLAGLVQVISGGKPYHITLQDYNKMCYLRKTQEEKMKMKAKRLDNVCKPTNPNIPGSVLKAIIPRNKPPNSNQKTSPIQIAPRPKEMPATITALPIVQKTKEISTNEAISIVNKESTNGQQNSGSETKNIIFNQNQFNQNQISINSKSIEINKVNSNQSSSPPKPAVMILPKIPKSLTVIPQTVSRKPTKPPSPTLSIITKPSTSKSSSTS